MSGSLTYVHVHCTFINTSSPVCICMCDPGKCIMLITRIFGLLLVEAVKLIIIKQLFCMSFNQKEQEESSRKQLDRACPWSRLP